MDGQLHRAVLSSAVLAKGEGSPSSSPRLAPRSERQLGGDKYARQSQRYFSSTNPRISQADAGECGSKVGWESYTATTRCCHELQSWFMPVQWACLAVLLETQLQTPEL